MVHLNNTCEITIAIRTPELTVDGKCLSVKIIYQNMMNRTEHDIYFNLSIYIQLIVANKIDIHSMHK